MQQNDEGSLTLSSTSCYCYFHLYEMYRIKIQVFYYTDLVWPYEVWPNPFDHILYAFVWIIYFILKFCFLGVDRSYDLCPNGIISFGHFWWLIWFLVDKIGFGDWLIKLNFDVKSHYNYNICWW